MGKETKGGTTFYRSAGLKAVTVHLPAKAHKKLVEMAKKEDRSLQKTIRRILMDFASKAP
jgi:hypothetical protein